MKKPKPYDVKKGANGKFVASGDQPLTFLVGLKLTEDLYSSLVAAAGGRNKLAPYIRKILTESLKA